MDLTNPTPQEYYRAAQMGMDGAEELGLSLMVDCPDDEHKGALATLARLRFIEHSIQLGLAQMTGLPVAMITRLSSIASLTLLLDRTMHHGLSVEDALALSGGQWGPELTKSVQEISRNCTIEEAVHEIKQFETLRPREADSEGIRITGINA